MLLVLERAALVAGLGSEGETRLGVSRVGWGLCVCWVCWVLAGWRAGTNRQLKAGRRASSTNSLSPAGGRLTHAVHCVWWEGDAVVGGHRGGGRCGAGGVKLSAGGLARTAVFIGRLGPLDAGLVDVGWAGGVLLLVDSALYAALDGRQMGVLVGWAGWAGEREEAAKGQQRAAARSGAEAGEMVSCYPD